MAALPAEISPHRVSLINKFAAKFSIDSEKLLPILKATCFKQEENKEVSNEQMAALLVVADQYGLNPFTRELFAFADKNRGIVPILSIDGWARIINERPELDGIEFVDGPPKTQDGKTVPEWIECVIYRKDRAHPIRVRERFAECRRGTGPWGSHPARMLRHKALIQCARVAFGFAGIYDEDEGRQIVERDITPANDQPRGEEAAKTSRTAATVEKVRRARGQTIEGEAKQEAGQEGAGSTPAQSQRPGGTGDRFESGEVARGAEGAGGTPDKAAAESAAGATDSESPAPQDEAKALLMLDGCEDRGAALELLDLCRGMHYEKRLKDALDKRFPD